MLRAIDKAGPYDFATLRATPDAGSTIFGLCAFGDADTEILLLWRVYVDAGSADLVLWSSTSSQFWVEIHSAASESTTGRVYCCLPAAESRKVCIIVCTMSWLQRRKSSPSASKSVCKHTKVTRSCSQNHKSAYSQNPTLCCR